MIVLILYLIILSINLFSEKVDYVIHYDFTYITDTANQTFSHPENYLLFKVRDSSMFMNVASFKNDSIMHIFESKGHPIHSQETVDLFMETQRDKMQIVNSDLRVMKDFKNNLAKIVLYGTWKREYMEKKIKLNWKTHSQKDSIAGFLCTKATTHYGGRDYTAWFTTDIPIPDGPYIFSGLPGLIIKIYDDQKWYTFEINKTNLKPSFREVIPNFFAEKYVTKIDQDSYIVQSIEKKNNPKLPSWMPNPTPEMKLRLVKKYKKRFDLLLEQNE